MYKLPKLRITITCQECDKTMFVENDIPEDKDIVGMVSFMKVDLMKRLKKGHESGKHVSNN